jgi:hypothetical protein
MTTVEAYGLAIQSELPLPDAPGTNAEAQVIFRMGKVAKPEGDPNAERLYQIDRKNFHVFWRGVGTFLIRVGSEVVFEPDPDTEEAILRLYLLGPVLGILLHQRGFLVLHASVVSIAGAAVGFLGEKGWGKSTTAAALNARGHALIADDILAIHPDKDSLPMVQPGLSQFKLWPEAVAASFGDDATKLARLHSKAEKRIRPAFVGSSPRLAPLRRLYLLDAGACLVSVPLSSSAALMTLVRHSYLAHLMPALEGVERNFIQCARVVRGIKLYRLERPKNLKALDQIVDLIEAETGFDRGRAAMELSSCGCLTS